MVAPNWKMPTDATPQLLNETDLVDKIAKLALPAGRRTTINPDGASLAQIREARDRNKAEKGEVNTRSPTQMRYN